MKIEWDPAKAAANVQAHGVSFGEAATVLEDDFALTREDPDVQGEPDVYRLISSWKANKPQRTLYEKNRR